MREGWRNIVLGLGWWGFGDVFVVLVVVRRRREMRLVVRGFYS